MSIRPESPCSTFRIPCDLTVQSIVQIQELMLTQIRAGEPFDADLSAVTSCDPLGIQMLLALRTSATRAAIPFRFIGSSEAVANMATDLGISMQTNPPVPDEPCGSVAAKEVESGA